MASSGDIAEIQVFLSNCKSQQSHGETWSLVPTMGYLSFVFLSIQRAFLVSMYI